MANLSNISPLSAGVTGLSQGINNASNIQWMVNKNDLMDQEKINAPLRTKLLESQIAGADTTNKMSAIRLQEAEQQQAYLNQPWDPMDSPIYKRGTPEQQTIFLGMVKNVTGGKVPTMQDKIQLAKTAATDKATWEPLRDIYEDQVNREVSEAGKVMADIQKRVASGDENANQGQYESAMRNYETAKGKQTKTKDELKILDSKVEMEDIMNRNPGFRAMFDSSDAMKMIGQVAALTGNPAIFAKAAEHLLTLESKDKTAFERYFPAAIQQKKNEAQVKGIQFDPAKATTDVVTEYTKMTKEIAYDRLELAKTRDLWQQQIEKDKIIAKNDRDKMTKIADEDKVFKNYEKLIEGDRDISQSEADLFNIQAKRVGKQLVPKVDKGWFSDTTTWELKDIPESATGTTGPKSTGIPSSPKQATPTAPVDPNKYTDPTTGKVYIKKPKSTPAASATNGPAPTAAPTALPVAVPLMVKPSLPSGYQGMIDAAIAKEQAERQQLNQFNTLMNQ